MKPKPMAVIVPRGIAFLGSFKSPDIWTPAVKPVTAGKNIPKMTKRLSLFSTGCKTNCSDERFDPPAKMEASDSRTAANIRY